VSTPVAKSAAETIPTTKIARTANNEMNNVFFICFFN